MVAEAAEAAAKQADAQTRAEAAAREVYISARTPILTLTLTLSPNPSPSP